MKGQTARPTPLSISSNKRSVIIDRSESRRDFRRTTNHAETRTAFTLVEILVAMTIATVLTAIALPTVKEAFRQNVTGKSASLVKGAFINARAQALRTGRPFGLVIERQRRSVGAGTPNQLIFSPANYATRLYYVQTPIAYRGDIQSAYAYPFRDLGVGGAPRFFIPKVSAGLIFAAAQQQQAALQNHQHGNSDGGGRKWTRLHGHRVDTDHE